MQLPMTGSWSIQLNQVRPFTIHGDIYWELHATRVEPPGEGTLVLRVPQHAARQAPVAGQRVTVAFLMGQVTSMVPIDVPIE